MYCRLGGEVLLGCIPSGTNAANTRHPHGEAAGRIVTRSVFGGASGWRFISGGRHFCDGAKLGGRGGVVFIGDGPYHAVGPWQVTDERRDCKADQRNGRANALDLRGGEVVRRRERRLRLCAARRRQDDSAFGVAGHQGDDTAVLCGCAVRSAIAAGC